MSLRPGSCVVLYLSTPREQVFGFVLGMSSAGVVLRGLSLASVEDWLRELSHGMEPSGADMGLATTFYPMHRVEKIALDEPSYGMPPIHERFRARTGFAFLELALGHLEPDGAADAS